MLKTITIDVEQLKMVIKAAADHPSLKDADFNEVLEDAIQEVSSTLGDEEWEE